MESIVGTVSRRRMTNWPSHGAFEVVETTVSDAMGLVIYIE